MTLRLSFGDYWFEIHVLSWRMLGYIAILQMECGHRSQRNLVNLWYSGVAGRFPDRVYLKIGRRYRTRRLYKGKAA